VSYSMPGRNRKWQLDPMHLEEFMEAQDWNPREASVNFDFFMVTS
jgi:hypothetical protein